LRKVFYRCGLDQDFKFAAHQNHDRNVAKYTSANNPSISILPSLNNLYAKWQGTRLTVTSRHNLWANSAKQDEIDGHAYAYGGEY
jgi:hypothetical protein